jgi:hypothetical protein
VTTSRVGWVRLSWRERFFWKRLAANLMLALGPAAVCFANGWGVPGLLLFALGCWPWPLRVTTSSQGLTLRWLLLREHWPIASISRLSLEQDGRRWAWPRRKVLVVEGRHGRRLSIHGNESELSRLASAMSRNDALAPLAERRLRTTS